MPTHHVLFAGKADTIEQIADLKRNGFGICEIPLHNEQLTKEVRKLGMQLICTAAGMSQENALLVRSLSPMMVAISCERDEASECAAKMPGRTVVAFETHVSNIKDWIAACQDDPKLRVVIELSNQIAEDLFALVDKVEMVRIATGVNWEASSPLLTQIMHRWRIRSKNGSVFPVECAAGDERAREEATRAWREAFVLK